MNRSRRICLRCRGEHRPGSPGAGGFTMVELLVVVMLITLLLGLLLPAMHAAKQKAATLQCQSNLRSLGLAVRMFADQHEGDFPKVTDCNQTPLQVRRQLEPYVGEPKVFRCRRDPERPTPPGGSYDWLVRDDPTSLTRKRIDLIPRASTVLIGGDRLPGWHKLKTINVVYLDGHVAQISEQTWIESVTQRYSIQ